MRQRTGEWGERERDGGREREGGKEGRRKREGEGERERERETEREKQNYNWKKLSTVQITDNGLYLVYERKFTVQLGRNNHPIFEK
jgi:hypothetical protein